MTMSFAEQIMNILIPKPEWDFKTNRFRVRNYSDNYYCPDGFLARDLKEMIIFPVNEVRNGIPHGSLWVYDKKADYKKKILSNSVGCGFSTFFIDKVDVDEQFIAELLKAAKETDVDLRGNEHFISFCEGHPYVKENKDLFVIHSCLSGRGIIPQTINEAIAFEKLALEKRIGMGERLLASLGIDGRYYMDWTHNSVREQDDVVIYRKGVIDTNEVRGEGLLSDVRGEGLLGMNPYHGFYFYMHSGKKEFHSIQSVLGRKSHGRIDDSLQNIFMSSDFQVLQVVEENIPKSLYDEYFSLSDGFLKYFNMKQSTIGFTYAKCVLSAKQP